ncbi:MAG TPA: hypothetical protein VLJ68_03150, partial [Chitinophagaceae bacterium]|nr:hypothetical protein [Chitinophagaceae bacterium]
GRYTFDQEPEQYLYTNGKMRWIQDLETLNVAGWGGLPLVTLPFGSQVGFAFGDPFPSRRDGLFYQVAGDAAIYVMDNGKRRWIPDPLTFNMINSGGVGVLNLSLSDLDAIPLGEQIPVQFIARTVLQEGALYQAHGTSEKYMVIDRSLRHIPDLETFSFLGLTEDMVTGVTIADLATLQKADDLPSRKNGNMLQVSGDPVVYYMENGVRRAIPDPETLNGMGLDWGQIKRISAADMQMIKMGPALISMK